MASQIVMDRTGDTRHIFDNQDRAEVAKAEQRFRELTGAGFTAAVRRARRTTGYPLLRSYGGGDVVLSASGWRLTRERANLACVGSCGLALLLWALLLVVAPSGSWATALRSETNAGADLAEGMALAGAARVLRALTDISTSSAAIPASAIGYTTAPRPTSRN